MPDLISCTACGQVVFASTVICWRCGRAVAGAGSQRTGARAAVLRVVGAMVLAAAALAGVLYVAIGRNEPSAAPIGVAAQERAPQPAATPVGPARAGTHVVGPNESLFSVAFTYEVTPAELRYWNRDTYPTLDSTPALQEGWVLRVTGPPLPTEAPDAPPVEVAAATPPPPPAGLVPLPVLTVDIWNAEVRYFEISGSSPAELEASISANIPPDPSGVSADALAYVGPIEWEFRPAYRPNGRSCTIAGTTTDVTYQATIPQWTAPAHVAPELLEWWRGVLEYIRWHEEQHVRIFEAYVDELPGRLAGQPCDAMQTIVNEWTTELIAAQDAFDAEERSWRPEPYTGP